MNEKRRPDNGPGANGLRGGVRSYSRKVTTGNWVEVYGGPQDYKRGFSTKDFETECQYQQKGATLRPPDEYGAALSLPHLLITKDPTAKDSFKTPGEFIETRSNQQINNEMMFTKLKEAKEYAPTPTLSREELDKYRKVWTSETEAGRKVRYVTESRLAGGAPNRKFEVNNIRLLPGTPKTVEEYRERLIKRYGLFGISAMRYYLGGIQTMEIRKFKEAIKTIGVDAKIYEVDGIIAFVTQSSTEVSTGSVLRAIKGSMPGFNPKIASSLYDSSDGGSVEGLVDAMQNIVPHPEVVEGFKLFIQGYTSNGELLTREEFIELHSDLHASSPEGYDTCFGFGG